MSSFHDVQLPDDVERGAKGGPGFNTNVLALANGIEKRNIEWEQARGSWDIGYGIQTKSGYQRIVNFFYSRRGKAYSFRFKDWGDFSMSRQSIGVGGAANADFQIFKTYSDAGGSYDRIISKPIASTIKVWKGGALQTLTTHYTVNALTGVIHFLAAPADTVIVEAACDFDVPVRFDIDKLDTELTWEDAGAQPEITIIEVIGE